MPQISQNGHAAQMSAPIKMRELGSLLDSSQLSTSPRRLKTWKDLSDRRPLPLRFLLLPSNRPGGKLCPSLCVHINGHVIVRIMDPEHSEPFVSLAAILHSAGLTVAEGLLRFGLRRDRMDFDMTLAGLEPWDEIWVPLATARRVAESLNILEPLASLLSWSTRHVWSLDEGSSGLVHNWRVPSSVLDPGTYSTASLTASEFAVVEPLAAGQMIRTLVSPEQRRSAMLNYNPPRSAEPVTLRQADARAVNQQLVRWSVQRLETFLSAQEEDGQSIKAPEMRGDTLDAEEIAHKCVAVRLLASLVQGTSLRGKEPLSVCGSHIILLPEELLGHNGSALERKGKATRTKILDGRSRRVWIAKLDLALACLVDELSLQRGKHEPNLVSEPDYDEAPGQSATRANMDGAESSQLNRIEAALTRLESRGMYGGTEKQEDDSPDATHDSSSQRAARFAPLSPVGGIINGALGLRLGATSPQSDRSTFVGHSKDDHASMLTMGTDGISATSRTGIAPGIVSNESIAVLLVVLICAVLWPRE
ncbi:hypothetical protein CBOM_05893 [Ceraceosorus bombacis]|uniref:Uncharacterized protein n=1 Tax=Ceraceosorus bombacis TaxID=401625 RepID=A0A0P1BJE2_9BASI|nr:hypothetical protein CBOM_05893 [Ceraceosorus bombacis]